MTCQAEAETPQKSCGTATPAPTPESKGHVVGAWRAAKRARGLKRRQKISAVKNAQRIDGAPSAAVEAQMQKNIEKPLDETATGRVDAMSPKTTVVKDPPNLEANDGNCPSSSDAAEETRSGCSFGAVTPERSDGSGASKAPEESSGAETLASPPLPEAYSLTAMRAAKRQRARDRKKFFRDFAKESKVEKLAVDFNALSVAVSAEMKPVVKSTLNDEFFEVETENTSDDESDDIVTTNDIDQWGLILCHCDESDVAFLRRDYQRF